MQQEQRYPARDGHREEGGKLNEREDGDETKKKKWCGARKDEEKKLAKFLAYHP